MEEAITAILLGDPRLAQLVGDRVHWDVAPQGLARPYVILAVISTDPATTMEGRSGLETFRVQIDSYSEQKLSTVHIAQAAFEALEKAQGPQGAGTLQRAFLDSKRDISASGAQGAPQLFRRSTDVIIVWHS